MLYCGILPYQQSINIWDICARNYRRLFCVCDYSVFVNVQYIVVITIVLHRLMSSFCLS